jgi:hypothetical protein
MQSAHTAEPNRAYAEPNALLLLLHLNTGEAVPGGICTRASQCSRNAQATDRSGKRQRTPPGTGQRGCGKANSATDTSGVAYDATSHFSYHYDQLRGALIIMIKKPHQPWFGLQIGPFNTWSTILSFVLIDETPVGQEQRLII